MNFLFISNYINHHQIPFCSEMIKLLGKDNFKFIQTQAMEKDRQDMGWGEMIKDPDYLLIKTDENTDEIKKMIRDYDVVLLGWSLDTDVNECCIKRAMEDKLLIRMSERIYRDGQWKAISPRGLVAKYKEHIRFRNKNVYMLCNGAYVASDFALIHAYKNKMFRWGYFPELKTYTDEQMKDMKRISPDGKLNIMWSGRFMEGVKNPDFVLDLAKVLKDKKIPFRMNIVGDGEMSDALHGKASDLGLGDVITFHGFLPPQRVRIMMEDSQIYLFTSNNLEGWGAVVNEAMNSGCAVVAGSMAGSVPYLISHDKNGIIYDKENIDDFIKKAVYLAENKGLQRRLGQNAYRTIKDIWNAEVAAKRLVDFCISRQNGEKYDAPCDGPMSIAPIIKPYIKVEGL